MCISRVGHIFVYETPLMPDIVHMLCANGEIDSRPERGSQNGENNLPLGWKCYAAKTVKQ